MEEPTILKPMQANCWSGAIHLETVRRLNERGLAFLANAARVSESTAELGPWKEILPLWARPSEGTLGRAARCPMVLLDFNFQHVGWWSRLINGRPLKGPWQAKWGGFCSSEAIPLARDLLMEAWSVSRSMPYVASLLFGMAPEVTRLIAQLSPCDVDRVVVHEAQRMTLRWENCPAFWGRLIHAATQTDDQYLANAHLQCLQLFGAELLFKDGKSVPSADAAKQPLTETSVTEHQPAKRSSGPACLSYAEKCAKPSPRTARDCAVIAAN
jgi:hypothetical protein